MVTAHIKPHHGLPSLYIDGTAVPAYFHYFPLPVREHIAAFARAGIHLFTWGWGSHVNHSMDMGWTAPGQQDFSKLDAEAGVILEADPEALLLPRIAVSAPTWWLDLHPDHRVRFSDGTTTHANGNETNEVTPASELWRREAGEALARLIRHVLAAPCGRRVIGFQVTGGMNEWFYSAGPKTPDFSPVAVEAFRRWLRERYRDDADALRRNWRRRVDFDSAEVPPETERLRTDLDLLRDPANSAAVLDFYRFMSETNAEALIHFCRIIKHETRGRRLAGGFYGYLLNMAAGYCGGVTSLYWGHNALSRVLASPDIDFLCAPNHYTWSGRGGFDGSQSVPESVQLHGKLWMSEIDQLTFVGRSESTMKSFARRPYANRMPTPSETLNRMKRDFAHAFIQGHGLWWMEQDRNFCRYDHPDILGLLARMVEIARQAAEMPRPARATEIAVFIDEEAPYHLRPGSGLLHSLRYAQVMYHLARIGAPFDLYARSDVGHPNLPRYRLYVFLDSLYLPEEDRSRTRQVIERAGATALWFFAPGLLCEAGIREEAMLEATGIRLRCEPARGDWAGLSPLHVHLSGVDHPITRDVRTGTVFGTDLPIGPLVYADDPDVVELGEVVLPHTRTGPPGLVARDLGRWKSVFCAVPNMPADLLRGVARWAGCHIYSDQDDVVYANSRHLAVHTLAGGQREIRLPRSARVTEVFAGRPVSSAGLTCFDTIGGRETRLYALAPLSRE